jgi:hypothetical protein
MILEKNFRVANIFDCTYEHKWNLPFLAYSDGLWLIVPLNFNSNNARLVNDLLNNPSILADHFANEIAWNVNSLLAILEHRSSLLYSLSTLK